MKQWRKRSRAKARVVYATFTRSRALHLLFQRVIAERVLR